MKRKTARKANDTDAAAGGRPLSKMPSDVVITCGDCGWRGPVPDVEPVCGGCGGSLAAADVVAARDARAAGAAPLVRAQPPGPPPNLPLVVDRQAAHKAAVRLRAARNARNDRPLPDAEGCGCAAVCLILLVVLSACRLIL